MISPDKIARINALARKAKAGEALTPAEAAEQAALRREYIDAVKASLAPQLESIRYVDPDGAVVNPQTGAVEGFVRDDPREDEA